jgi:hypothetical protein
MARRSGRYRAGRMERMQSIHQALWDLALASAGNDGTQRKKGTNILERYR